MSVIYPNVAAMQIAATNRTALAASELGLFTAPGSPIGPGTILADLPECDYDGYARKTVATWNPPYLDPAGGASIQSGTKQFDYGPAGSPPTGNSAAGFFVVDTDGNLILVGTFEEPIAMNAIGDSIPLNVVLNFGRS